MDDSERENRHIAMEIAGRLSGHLSPAQIVQAAEQFFAFLQGTKPEKTQRYRQLSSIKAVSRGRSVTAVS